MGATPVRRFAPFARLHRVRVGRGSRRGSPARSRGLRAAPRPFPRPGRGRRPRRGRPRAACRRRWRRGSGTVLSLTTSRRAIAALVSPRATRSRISRSRSVSSGKGLAVPAPPRANQARTREARRGAEHHLTVGDGLQGPGDLLPVGTLQQVAPGARPHRREQRVVALEHGQHEHGRAGQLRRDPPGRLDAAEPGQVQVHDDDVRRQSSASSTAWTPSPASATTSTPSSIDRAVASPRDTAGGRPRRAPSGNVTGTPAAAAR